MTLLDVSELIFVLQEALAAVLTHRDGHVWNHVLVELAWHIWTELGVVNDVDFFISHVLEDSFVNFNRFGAVWVNLGLHLLKHFLCEQIVIHIIVLVVVEGQGLLITVHTVLLPTILMGSGSLLCFHASIETSTLIWWIHSEALKNSLVIQVS